MGLNDEVLTIQELDRTAEGEEEHDL